MMTIERVDHGKAMGKWLAGRLEALSMGPAAYHAEREEWAGAAWRLADAIQDAERRLAEMRSIAGELKDEVRTSGKRGVMGVDVPTGLGALL